MQNKANFRNAKMNVNTVITKDYENKSNWTLGENKPNTKPIKANTKPIKANKMPKQTQYKPNQTQPVVSLSNLFQTAGKKARKKGTFPTIFTQNSALLSNFYAFLRIFTHFHPCLFCPFYLSSRFCCNQQLWMLEAKLHELAEEERIDGKSKVA